MNVLVGLLILVNKAHCHDEPVLTCQVGKGQNRMTPQLKDQVVVITGASSGIGRATALGFGKAGAKVVLAARNVVGLQEVADAIRDMGSEVLVVPTDVADWAQVERLAHTAVTAFGRIDTWVNDAGVGVYATAEETSVEET